MTKKKIVAVFYLSSDKGPGRQRLVMPDGRYVYIRIEQAEAGLDVGPALDEAGPRHGETVMNSHEV